MTKPPAMPEPLGWYVVNNIGMATLCADKQDATQVAVENSIQWPNLAPHRAMQLCDAGALQSAQPAAQDGTCSPCEGEPMSARKAAYFMQRFKREEKLLGPNERLAIEFVLALLDAQPAEVPVPMTMTEQWRLLNSGDQIQAGDECLQDDCVTWLPLAGWEVGMTYNPHVLVPMRRRVEAFGITAQAKGGQV